MNKFRIESKENLFQILGYEEEKVLDIINDKAKGYIRYCFEKKNGYRIVYGIDKNHSIYSLQKNLSAEIFENMLFPECVYGFCKHKSYFDFLVPHISRYKKRYYLRLDISDFFDSIKPENIRDSLLYYLSDDIEDGEMEKIIELIVDIVTLKKHTVQGAVTSPVISNLVFRRLDIRIEQYCKKLGVKYTRYADDMLFSSDSSFIHNYKFARFIQNIIKDKNFKLNHSKTLKYKNEISLNGYVLGTDIRLSRKKFSSINKIIFKLNESIYISSLNKRERYTYMNKLAGYRSYFINASRYICDEQKSYIEDKIKIIEKLILKLCV